MIYLDKKWLYTNKLKNLDKVLHVESMLQSSTRSRASTDDSAGSLSGDSNNFCCDNILLGCVDPSSLVNSAHGDKNMAVYCSQFSLGD